MINCMNNKARLFSLASATLLRSAGLNSCALSFTNGLLADGYGIQSLPASFLLDKDGKIIALHLRGEALVKKIESLLSGS